MISYGQPPIFMCAPQIRDMSILWRYYELFCSNLATIRGVSSGKASAFDRHEILSM
jgi:hypothetical protein